MTSSFHPAVPVAARVLEQWYGIVISACRLPLLASELARIGERAGAQGALDRLLTRDPAAWDQLIDAMTVPETYLFRHFGHFELLRDLVDRRHGEGRPCRVLSAGCSGGEEVWSAAAVLADAMPCRTVEDLVVGWDVNEHRLGIARKGHYGAWSVRAGLRGYDAYFHQHDDYWEVSAPLRQRVLFQRVNLVDELRRDNAPFDAIFFRNVGIYWDEAVGHRVVHGLAELLVDDGLFFFGPSDPGLQEPERWEHVIGDGVRYYRRSLRATEPPPAPPLTQRLFQPVPPPLSDAGRRGARPKRLSTSLPFRAARSSFSPCSAAEEAASAAPAARTTPTAVSGGQATSAETMTTVKHFADTGRYEEALSALEARARAETLEARLWKGILLLNLERATESIDQFRQCVFLEPEQSTYRRWLAVAYEATGRTCDAEREYRNATELNVP